MDTNSRTLHTLNVVRHVMNLPTLLFLASICVSCHSSSSLRTEQESVSQPIATDSAYWFDLKSDFEVTFTHRVSNYPSSDTDTVQCQGWNLDPKEIKEAIVHSKPITGTEWDLSFSDYPCAIIGELRQSGNDFRLELNAGSWFIIKSADKTERFGVYDSNFTKLFLSPPAGEMDQK